MSPYPSDTNSHLIIDGLNAEEATWQSVLLNSRTAQRRSTSELPSKQDRSARPLARARKPAHRVTSQAGCQTNLKFELVDAESIPIEAGSVDVAIVNGIFNLNPARSTIFAELASVIRPEGLLFAAELVLEGPLPCGVHISRHAASICLEYSCVRTPKRGRLTTGPPRTAGSAPESGIRPRERCGRSVL